MIRIGIDLSINSSCVCVMEDGKKPVFYLIVPKMTYKMSAVNYGRICYITYDKINGNITHNVYAITEKISQIIANYAAKTKDIQINIEDISMGSKGRSVIDLSILSGAVRYMLESKGITPRMLAITSWKKNMIGNAFADKSVIIDCGRMLEPEIYEQTRGVKTDDIFDSYFIARS